MSDFGSDLMHFYEIVSYNHTHEKEPIIGISIESIDSRISRDSFWYSAYPWYAIGRRYCDAVVKFGGIPVLLCLNLSSVSHYAKLLDGIIIQGISFDMDPVFYGDPFKHKTTVTRPERAQFDMAIVKKMIDQNKPVLGINYGCQLINVVSGGTLYQHIPEEVPNAKNHTQRTLLIYQQHRTKILPGTNLYDISSAADTTYSKLKKDSKTGCLVFRTNSYHHQCIKEIGTDMRVFARAEDDVIEGIESTNHNFCIGTQWNAEFLSTPIDIAIFNSFVDSARKISLNKLV
ncbi:MAG: gamma-glutamyl-gamma-aminobutyrate hydrolase family protein [Bacteroidales bacterium]|jgi:putative glutamine amidotransferase|nr:gamma-glutamyl-gamma-aminobutyrate hydrolase family protein [Bacteroidales bacterium]